MLNPTGANRDGNGNFCDPFGVGGAFGTGTGGIAHLVAQPPANFWQPFRLDGHGGVPCAVRSGAASVSIQPIVKTQMKPGERLVNAG